MDDLTIMKWQPIHNMVAAYDDACGQVRQAFSLLTEAKKTLKLAFGEYGDGLWENRIHDNDFDLEAEKSQNYMKRQAWQRVVERAQMRNMMSSKKADDLDKQLSDPKQLPEFTIENIRAVIENLGANVETLMTDVLAEVFELLRPRSSQYKTNTEFAVGGKAILEGILSSDYPKYAFIHLSYGWGEKKLRALDNAFHLMDGKGPIKYPGDLLTQVETAIRDKRWSCESDYFVCEWFKKGSFHVRFKRMDLVAELNRRCGGNRLAK